MGGLCWFSQQGTYNTTNLRIEYATSEKVLGPYEPRGTLLKTASYGDVKIVAPVGLDVVGSNVSEAVFEAWKDGGNRERATDTVVLKYERDAVTIV